MHLPGVEPKTSQELYYSFRESNRDALPLRHRCFRKYTKSVPVCIRSADSDWLECIELSKSSNAVSRSLQPSGHVTSHVNINLGGPPRFSIPSSSALPSCSLANILLRPLATTVLRKRAASIRRSSLRRQAVRRLPLQPLRLRTPLARLRLHPCVPYARSRSQLTLFRQDCFAPIRDGASSHTTLFPSAVSETVEAGPPPASTANTQSVCASGPVSLLPVRHPRTLPF